MNAAEKEVWRCQNCQREWSEGELPIAKGIFSRHEPGTPFSDRECPECGAVCYPISEYKKWEREDKTKAACGQIVAYWETLVSTAKDDIPRDYDIESIYILALGALSQEDVNAIRKEGGL